MRNHEFHDAVKKLLNQSHCKSKAKAWTIEVKAVGPKAKAVGPKVKG